MGRVTILDGGMGRELKRVGAPFRQPEWSALAMIASPSHVAQVHESYVRAGADVITTNAYALVPFHLGQERFDSVGAALAASAGEVARDVVNRLALGRVRVAGCLPPVLGSYRPDLFDPALAGPILEVLVREQDPYVDVWIAETLSSVAEAELVRTVVDAAGSTHPLWCSFTLDDQLTGGTARVRSGESVSAGVRAAEGIGAETVSFNCSQPEVMAAAVREAGSVTSLPIGVYANAFVIGESEGANASLHELRSDVTPQAYLDWARLWVEAGASMIGGCCGVGPEHVNALSADLAGS